MWFVKRPAEERILDSLFPSNGSHKPTKAEKERHTKTRDRLRQKLLNGDFEDREIEVEVIEETTPMMQILGRSVAMMTWE